MKRISFFLGCTFLLILCFISIMCTQQISNGKFAIYLAKLPNSTRIFEKDHSIRLVVVELSNIILEDLPIVTEDDISSYSKDTHTIYFIPEYKHSKIDIPVSGRIFVVCVGSKRIYWGAFWTKVSSMGFNGVVIKDPGMTWKLDLGYPTSKFYEGPDPRNSELIFRRLRQIGKLK